MEKEPKCMQCGETFDMCICQNKCLACGQAADLCQCGAEYFQSDSKQLTFKLGEVINGR